MVITADNVGNTHVVVVHDDAEVVGRRAVGAGDNQVGRDFGQGFACFGAPAAVVSRRAFFFGFLAHAFQLFFAAIAVVGMAFF